MDTLPRILKLLHSGGPDIDNLVFTLNCRFTVALLFVCSTLVTFKNHFGDPIDCLFDRSDMAEILDTYCYSYSTYTTAANGDDVYLTYYQWVSTVQFLQALAFRFPYHLWLYWEGHRMATLTEVILNKDYSEADKKIVVKSIYQSFAQSRMDCYLYYFVFCEILNFLNVLLQIYLTNVFLGGEFAMYGWEVLKFTNMGSEFRADPMAQLFPIKAKCTFHKVGPSGSIENLAGLCVLTLNVLNEKVYLVLWAWFLIVALLSGLVLSYRVTTIVFSFRRYVSFATSSAEGEPTQNVFHAVKSKCSIGEWFFLKTLGKNIAPEQFSDILDELLECLKW